VYRIHPDGILQHISTGTIIPRDPRNAAYRKYLEWTAQGNTAVSLAANPVDLSNLDNMERAIKALGLVIAEISGRTPNQIRALFKQKFDQLG
jgi:hypothetical protein